MLRRFMMKSGLIALACCASFIAHAMADSPKAIDVPAGALVPALEALQKQAAVELVYQAEQLKSFRTGGVKGTYTAHDAVQLLLKGTPLELRTDPSGAMLIAPPRAHTTSTGTQAQPPPTPGSPTGDSLQLGQTTSEQAQGSASVDKEPAAPDQGSELHAFQPNTPEILIKGSRIMNVDVKRTEDDVQPYTIFSSEQIEQSGAANVEDFLKQQLTMNTVAQTNSQGFATIAGTTSSINLRGLGTNETLILIDGRRSAAVSILGNSNQTDINGIPIAAIERIEVLPSSASAIYGGAAVGGIVNIILKKNFDGGDVRYTYDRAVDSNADKKTVSANYGFSFGDGRTQVLLGGQYSDGSPLLLGDRLNLVNRGISAIAGNDPAYLYNPANPFPGATPNIASADSLYAPTPSTTPFALCGLPLGTFIPGLTSAPNTAADPCFVQVVSPLVLKNGTSLNSPITSIPAGAAPGSNLSAGLLANAGKYNLGLSPTAGEYGLLSPFGTVPLTKSLFATLRQRLFDDVEFFTEFSTSSNTGRTIADAFNGVLSVPASAPTDPFQQDVSITFPSNVTANQSNESVSQSVTTGLIVPLPHSWSSELDYTWSRNSFESAFEQADMTALGSALAAGTVNPFADTVAYPIGLKPYLAPVTISGSSTLDDLGLRASGPFALLPAGSATLTVGLEHRKEGSGNGSYDQTFPLTPASTSERVFFGQSQSTNSAYAEVLIPLIADRNNVIAVRSLELQIAGRSERYTVNAGTPYEFILPVGFPNPPQGVHSTITYTSTNPTVGFKYQPIGDVTIRSSFSTAFLPPTASELLRDPTPLCGPTPCELITDPKNGQSYNVNLTGGGNPNLQPQTSRDWDAGLVWEPQEQSLKGVRVDLEYYKITQPNYITTPTLQQIINDPAFANRISRDPTTGLITTVDDSYANAIEYKTSGWDVSADYHLSTSAGTYGLHAAGTYIKYDLRQSSINAPFLEYAGFPNDGGEGKLKAAATLSWGYRHWMVAWTTTYYAGYYQIGSPGSPDYIQFGSALAQAVAQGASTIPSQTYHDLYASYTLGAVGSGSNTLGKITSDLTVTVGIKNVFNTAPPFDAYYAPYFYSPYGDARMRDYWISVRKGF